MKSYPGMGDVSSCSTPSCSGGTGGSGGSDPVPTPAPPTAKMIETMIEFADVTTFKMAEYLKAVEAESGGTGAEAMVEKLEVFLTYLVPEGSTDSALITAVATAMGGIAETLITICSTTTCHNHGSRRLTTERRLTTSKTVNIEAGTDTATAADYTTKSTSTATTDALTTALGAAVTVGTTPKTKMKIKTTVTSNKPKSELETSLKSNSMATKVGGSITSIGSDMETNSNSGFHRPRCIGGICMSLRGDQPRARFSLILFGCGLIMHVCILIMRFQAFDGAFSITIVSRGFILSVVCAFKYFAVHFSLE